MPSFEKINAIQNLKFVYKLFFLITNNSSVFINEILFNQYTQFI